MHILIFFSILTNVTIAQNISPKQELRLQSKKEISYEDLSHENPGCPENSNCSEKMGLLYKKFLTLFNQPRTNLNELNKFKNKYGIPLSFYSNQIADDIISYSSRCRQHNPKDGLKINQSTMFLKKFQKTKGMSFKYLTLIENKISFPLSIEDTPLYIENNKIIVIRETQDHFYYIETDKNGNINLLKPAKNKLKIAKENLDKLHECSVGEFDSDIFTSQICRKIYNFDSKKPVSVRIDWDCP